MEPIKKKSPLENGFKGGIAMSLQITSLLWLRTITSYQYKHGYQMIPAIKELYKQGGPIRFYRGYLPSLCMGSLCRFGDITAYTLIQNRAKDWNLSLPQQTFISSSMAMMLRYNLMPLDTLDVMLQVEGKPGYSILKNKIKNHGLSVLYHGSAIWSISNLMGNFSWFLTYGYLNTLNLNEENSIFKNALLGFACSSASDITTNPLRVIKLNRQSHPKKVSYPEVFNNIVSKEGYLGLWSRGLKTRILTHGIQSAFFVAIWKYIEQYKLT